MSVLKKEFGFAHGYKSYLITLENQNGVKVNLTNYSAAIVNIIVPDKNGKPTDVVLGYDDLEGYIEGCSSQGAVVGRYANRIGGAKFTLNGKEYKLAKNNGENCLHGGNVGFNQRVWTLLDLTDGAEPNVTFGYVSPDGEENFPGTLTVTVNYRLTLNNGVKISYSATTDEDTVINLTNHSYFNLGGFDGGKVLATKLQIFADGYTTVSPDLIPDGNIAKVEGTVFDFTEPKAIGTDIEAGKTDGYDHNYILGECSVMKKAAIAENPANGIVMTMYTDKPAVQLYTANGLNETGKGGKNVGKHCAFCLESQFTPDSPNLKNFPSCVLKKGERYNYCTIYEFSVNKQWCICTKYTTNFCTNGRNFPFSYS